MHPGALVLGVRRVCLQLIFELEPALTSTAINKDDWCGNYQADAPTTSVTYDEAGLDPIIVASDKTLIGSGSAGVLKGRGLRIAGGSNIIIQNIAITELNPQYVWGGDAITLDGSDMVWIDHVKVTCFVNVSESTQTDIALVDIDDRPSTHRSGRDCFWACNHLEQRD